MTSTGTTQATPAADAVTWAVEMEAAFAGIVDELTRRDFLGGVTGAAGLLGLAACGSSGTTSTTTSSTPSTRQVDTAKGTVVVPANPRRIVAIQPSASATLYDLGMDPVGVYDQGADYISPRYRGPWSSAPKIGTDGQINVEKVAALQPDLIIGVDYTWNTSVYGKLTALAPTVIAPATSWQDIAHTTANAVNKLPALTKLQQQLTTRSARLKTTYAVTLARYRWDILQGGFDTGQYWLYGPDSDTGTILAAAGVRFARGTAQTPGNSNRALSYEQIDVLADADVIGFYANYDDTPNNQGPQLFAQAAFKTLPAVTSGHTVPIPDFLPGGYGDALAVLEELETGLKRLATT